MRILIVEDEALTAMMVTDSLKNRGHEVIGPATTASEALALCEVAPPDLALLDIKLQDGSDGVALAHLLFARWGLPMIFASGQLIEAWQAWRVRNIALGYIRKPYDDEALLGCVEVARELISGGAPVTMPTGFELFR